MAEHELETSRNVRLLGPLGYREFLQIRKNAKVVLTDNCDLQEEMTALVVSCLTLRDSTERPVTIEMGANMLVGSTEDCIVAQAHQVLAAKEPSKNRSPLWDGNASPRILMRSMPS